MPADGIALVSLQRAIDEAVASLAAMIIYAQVRDNGTFEASGGAVQKFPTSAAVQD